tara:strand:- start:136 stop:618 length:483 start_codon:yes stop_codon:yes gene_type:complete
MNIKKIGKVLLVTISIHVGLILAVIILYLSFLGYWSIKYPDPICNNTNKIFDEYSPQSQEYKTELSRLLKKTENLETDYWFDRYIDTNHISIFIQNDHICAKGYIVVSKDKLKNDGGFMTHLMAVKGSSYGGPLLGLKFEFGTKKEKSDIFLIAVEDIID